MAISDRTRHGAVLSPAAALLSVLMPGAGHLAVGARLRPAVVAAAVANVGAMVGMAAVLAHVGNSTDFATVVADRASLLMVAALLAVMAATRLWSALDAAWCARPQRASKATLSFVGLAVLLVVLVGVAPLVVAADYVRRTDAAVATVFDTENAVTANPGTIATTSTTSTTSTTLVPTTEVEASTTSSSSTTSTTAPPFPGLDRVNVLLLGGDAGPGRYSLRTDSMIVISVQPSTGDTAMISIPRNLTRMPFPPDTKLAKQFPDGFTDLANAVYTYVDAHPALVDGVPDAGAQAIKLGIAQLLGIPIQHYVLVDMAGFVDVVDALGGIDIYVPRTVPSPGNPRNAKHPVPSAILQGQQHMDGTLALAYARTRSADSDYNRMGRQRCVLAAISNAATPLALATGLPAMLTAFGEGVHTDIPRKQLGDFAKIVRNYADTNGTGGVRTLHLAPPLVKPSHWDAAKVRALVSAVIAPQPPPEFNGSLPVLADSCTR